MQTDVALVQTRAVAGSVVNQLKLPESVPKFLGSYTVAATTDQVMTITLSAKTSAEAVLRAGALAIGLPAVPDEAAETGAEARRRVAPARRPPP